MDGQAFQSGCVVTLRDAMHKGGMVAVGQELLVKLAEHGPANGWFTHECGSHETDFVRRTMFAAVRLIFRTSDERTGFHAPQVPV